MVPLRHVASRCFTAGQTRQGSDRINPARVTERAMVLNQPVDQFDPLALIGPVTEIVPGTSAMRRIAGVEMFRAELTLCANNGHSSLAVRLG